MAQIVASMEQLWNTASMAQRWTQRQLLQRRLELVIKVMDGETVLKGVPRSLEEQAVCEVAGSAKQHPRSSGAASE